MPTTTTAATKPTAVPSAKKAIDLSASQREGAIERAQDAALNASRVHGATKPEHKLIALIGRAASDADRYATDAVVAGSVADAQYASRKAVEAAAAAAWLFSQR